MADDKKPPMTEEEYNELRKGSAVQEMYLEVPQGATEEEIERLIHEKLREKHPEINKDIQIKTPPSEKVRFYGSEITMLLDCFGIQATMLSDWSRLGDFPIDAEELKEVSEELGIPLSFEDRLWEIGQRIAVKQ